MSLVFAREPSLGVAEYTAIIGATYMAALRPLSNPARVERMLRGANMIVTAREDGALVGLLRGMSDEEWVCYVADLAVHPDHQRKGIGTGLLDTCKTLLGPGMSLVLVAFPEAVDYYRRIGMKEMQGFYIAREIAS